MILDKYPRTVEKSSVPLRSTEDFSTVPPELIKVVKAAAGLCCPAVIEVQRVA
jgi:hypothetical protein